MISSSIAARVRAGAAAANHVRGQAGSLPGVGITLFDFPLSADRTLSIWSRSPHVQFSLEDASDGFGPPRECQIARRHVGGHHAKHVVLPDHAIEQPS